MDVGREEHVSYSRHRPGLDAVTERSTSRSRPVNVRANCLEFSLVNPYCCQVALDTGRGEKYWTRKKGWGLSRVKRVRITEFGQRFLFLLLCGSSEHPYQYGEHY